MKAKKAAQSNPAPDPLPPMICVIRGQRVILDADLAHIYDVATFRFNEAFKRNCHRFPEDFAFQLTSREFAALRSSMQTQKPTPNSSQTAMTSARGIREIKFVSTDDISQELPNC
jgi:ORF6N domain